MHTCRSKMALKCVQIVSYVVLMNEKENKIWIFKFFCFRKLLSSKHPFDSCFIAINGRFTTFDKTNPCTKGLTVGNSTFRDTWEFQSTKNWIPTKAIHSGWQADTRFFHAKATFTQHPCAHSAIYWFLFNSTFQI